MLLINVDRPSCCFACSSYLNPSCKTFLYTCFFQEWLISRRWLATHLIIGKSIDFFFLYSQYCVLILISIRDKDRIFSNNAKWSKSERERKTPYDITYMWNLKYDTNELIYKTEPDSQTYRTDLWLSRQRRAGKEWIGCLGLADSNYYIRMDKQ